MRLFLPAVMLLALSAGCERTAHIRINARDYEIESYPRGLAGGEGAKLTKSAAARFEELSDQFFGDAGLIARLNRERSLKADGDGLEMLRAALALQQETAGRWSPAAGGRFADDDTLRQSLSIGGDGTARLAPGATLQLDEFARGWAIDAAADVMISGGVPAGKIASGNLSRFWGEPTRGDPWEFAAGKHDGDHPAFRYRPPPGGLFRLDWPGAQVALREETWPDGLSALAVWGRSAAAAAALAACAVQNGAEEAVNWFSLAESRGLFLVYPDTSGILAESDRNFSGWLMTEAE